MIGLDFGTTNSSIAVADGQGDTRLALFRDGDAETGTFRSVLFFDEETASRTRRPVPLTGPEAIRSYLDTGARGRLLQSLKSHLGSAGLTETHIFGWRFTIEELVATLLRDLLSAAGEQLGAKGRVLTLGRPVHFVVGDDGSVDLERDAFAETRLRNAAALAGFEQVFFEYEPVAAAYQYERQLDHDEMVLIGDFGGGTSDFCILRLGPSKRERPDRSQDILGVAGVPVAGGAFDARITRSVVAPRLGLGSERRSMEGKILPAPAWIFNRLERWEDLCLLKSRPTMELLRQLRYESLAPRKIEALLHLVDNDLTYHLYQSVERAKVELSNQQSTEFEFRDPPIAIREVVSRETFDRLLADQIDRLAASIDGLLQRCGLTSEDIDRVFLTGGSSLVPCVRSVFETRFGAERLRGGEELTTVARGLALAHAHRA